MFSSHNLLSDQANSKEVIVLDHCGINVDLQETQNTSKSKVKVQLQIYLKSETLSIQVRLELLTWRLQVLLQEKLGAH